METPEKAMKTLSVEARIACALAAGLFVAYLARAACGTAARPLAFYRGAAGLERTSPFMDGAFFYLLFQVAALAFACVVLVLNRPETLGCRFALRTGVLAGALSALAVAARVGAAMWEYGSGHSHPSDLWVLLVVLCTPIFAFLLWVIVRDRFGPWAAALSLVGFLAVPVALGALIGVTRLRVDANDCDIAMGACSPFWAFAAQATLWVWLTRRVPERSARRGVRAVIYWAWAALFAAPFVYVVVKIAWLR